MDIDFVVIIPCYRRFDLLENCVATVPDEPNIEVLIIDDASPIEDFEAFKLKMAGRKNVRLFRNEQNRGAGYSRNFGLKYARDNIRGEAKQWIIFSDDDDAFTQDAFAIFSQHKDSPADIIYFQADFQDYRKDKEGRDYDRYFEIKNYVMKEFLVRGNSKIIRAIPSEPWAKMFSKAFLEKEGLLLREVGYSEDLVFVVEAGLKAGHIEAFEQKVYVYKIYAGSNSRMSGDLQADLVRFNESCALTNVMLSHKGYLLYLHDCLLSFFKLLRRYGLKNAKPIFAVLKQNGLHLAFYCLLKWLYKLVTFIPRRINRRIKQAKYNL